MEPVFQRQKSQRPEADRPNLTGIPVQMKLDFERRSGLSFDDVRVHYHSEKPAQLQALAYTQGTQVYVGPGQERHLPHELGHVIQQKRGAVRPTALRGGVPVNESPDLERSADSLAGASHGAALQEIIQFYRTPGKQAETPLTKEAQRQRGPDSALDIPSGRLADYEARFVEGKLYAGNPPALVNTKVIFVVSTDKKLYVRPEPEYWGRDAFTHSSFLSGGAVATAGEMHVRGGVITLISNASGHYQPVGNTLEYLLDLLEKEGADLSQILMQVIGEAPHLYRAAQYNDADKEEALEDLAEHEELAASLLEDERKTQQLHDMGAGLPLAYQREPGMVKLALTAYTEADVADTIKTWVDARLVDAYSRLFSDLGKPLTVTIFYKERAPARPSRPPQIDPIYGPGALNRAKAAFLDAFAEYTLAEPPVNEKKMAAGRCSVTYQILPKPRGGAARPPEQGA